MDIEIRRCTSADVDILMQMTYELMEYHDMTEMFSLTKERFCELLDSEKLISYAAFADSQPAGVINYFYKLTTFSGRKILYLEDLYVREKYRRSGIAVRFFDILKENAEENYCEYIEWKCADFNESAKRFYEAIGSKPMNGWATYTYGCKIL